MPRVDRKRLLSSSESESDGEIADSQVDNVGPESQCQSNVYTQEIDSTLPTPSKTLAPLTSMTSTPKRTDKLVQLEVRLDTLIGAHKNRLRQLRHELKADNAEFLSVVEGELSGGQVAYSNENEKAVIHNGRNLMDIVAGSDPCRFGRDLAKAIFGEEEDCLLQNYMIGQQRSKMNSRPRVELSLERLFTTVVRQKYSKEPDYCLREARAAANQLGLDFKKKALKRNATEPGC